MFEDNNLWFLLFATLPAIIYSLIIFHKSPKGSVKPRAMWGYIIIGLLSIQILKLIHFLFPKITQYIETVPVLKKPVVEGFAEFTNEPTLWAIIVLAFFQVSFLEEISKWMAFKVGNIVRRENKIRPDSPFAIMFYCVMISVGFAAFENVHYVGRALWGDLQGVNPNYMLLVRSVNSVVVHMLSGLFMGYFIAIGRGCINILSKNTYTLVGMFVASLFHGMYDFNLMKGVTKSDVINIFGIDLHINNNLMIIIGMTIAYFLANHLRRLSPKYKLLR